MMINFQMVIKKAKPRKLLEPLQNFSFENESFDLRALFPLYLSHMPWVCPVIHLVISNLS